MSDTHPSPNLIQSLYLIADEMRGMASVGQRFAGNVYETERAERMMALAAEIAALASDLPSADLQRLFKQDFDTALLTHASPLIGAEAAVINETGEMLLIQRKDNAHWAMPGGLAEIGRTIPESVLLELWEEAGLRGRVERLLAVFDGRTWGSRFPGHIIIMVYLVTCDDLTPEPGIETLDTRFFARDALPTALHPGHDVRILKVFEILDRVTPAAYHDPADSRGITLPMPQCRNGV